MSGGEFEGEAQFTGAAWAWTGMQFSGKTADGNQIVEGKDEFRSNSMTADKRVLDASGNPSRTILARHTPIGGHCGPYVRR
jgi:hypothetical protein